MCVLKVYMLLYQSVSHFVNASHGVCLNEEYVNEFMYFFLFLSGYTSRTSKSRNSSA